MNNVKWKKVKRCGNYHRQVARTFKNIMEVDTNGTSSDHENVIQQSKEDTPIVERSESEYYSNKRYTKGKRNQKREELFESDEEATTTSGTRSKPVTSNANKRATVTKKVLPAENFDSDEDIIPKKSKPGTSNLASKRTTPSKKENFDSDEDITPKISKPGTSKLSLKRKIPDKKSTVKFSGLFESDSEEEAAIKQKTKKEDLQSVLTRRVADGVLRRTATLDGDVFIDLKVYNTREIVSIDPKERWQYAVLSLKLQSDSDARELYALKDFIRQSKSRFTEEGKFFAAKKF